MDKKLTIFLVKKLSNMDFDEKVRLFARLAIMRKNSQISGLLSRIVGTEELALVKTELVHHLYDENDNHKFNTRYLDLMEALKDSKNVYDNLDTYTLCAYLVYFDNFINYVYGAKNLADIRNAKYFAYVETLNYVDPNQLVVYSKQQSFGSLLNKEYRNSLIRYLTKDLNAKNSTQFFQDYLQGDLNQEVIYNSNPIYSPYKTYANQVEQYLDKNGNVYYLDCDGNYLDASEIEDFKYNDITIRATKQGLVCSSREDELTK